MRSSIALLNSGGSIDPEADSDARRARMWTYFYAALIVLGTGYIVGVIVDMREFIIGITKSIRRHYRGKI
jgi:hypothetical protein